MSGDLTAYRAAARDWLRANMDLRVDRGPDERTEAERFAASRVLQRRLYEGGYAGITWPKEYGGQGLPLAYQNAFDEEAADFVTPDFGRTALTTFGVCGPTILACASEEFKRRHIPRILAGEELWAQFFSEPEAGSDLANVRTTAVRSGDGWLINGGKIWSSYAYRCDFGLCLVRTNPDAPKHHGLTWFAVPTEAPGLTLREIVQIDGQTGFCQEFFDNVRVPDDERVGDVDAGWSVTRTMLVFERDAEGRRHHRELAPGDLAPDLVQIAAAAGRLTDPVVRQLIVGAHARSYIHRHLTARAADFLGLAESDYIAAALGKLAQGIYDPLRARAGIEIAGPAAAAWQAGPDGATGHSAAMSYLNGRIFSIAGGTNEMQRNVIAERLLGLPREYRPT